MDLSHSQLARSVGDRIRSILEKHLPPEWCYLEVGVNVNEASFVDIQRRWGAILYEHEAIGPRLPREYGGMSLSADAECLYVGELGRAGAPDPANGNAIDNFGLALSTFGDDDQRARFLPKMLSHGEIWCQGFSEPEAGSDLGGIRTAAVCRGDRLLINGQKVWTSKAQYARWCYLLVRTDPHAERHAGLSMVVVDMHQPGVEVRPIRQISGSSEFCEVFFDDAEATIDDVVGGLGSGWKVATFTLAQERSRRMALRSLQLGQSFAEIIKELRPSAPGGLAHRFSGGIVDAFVDTLLVESLVRRNIALEAGGEELAASAPMGKLVWSEAAQRQAELALALLGSGWDARHERRATAVLASRAVTIYGGTSEVQRNLIARAAGLPPSH